MEEVKIVADLNGPVYAFFLLDNRDFLDNVKYIFIIVHLAVAKLQEQKREHGAHHKNGRGLFQPYI